VPPSGARWTASTATTGRPTSTAPPTASSTPRCSTAGSTPPPVRAARGLKALQADYPTHEAAREGIAKAITDFYAQSYPQVASEKKDAVTDAGRALGDIWCWNVFPKMNIKWGTYRNHIGTTST